MGKLAIQPNIGPIYAYDLEKGRRKSTFEDFINMQKLAQSGCVCVRINSSVYEKCKFCYRYP